MDETYLETIEVNFKQSRKIIKARINAAFNEDFFFAYKNLSVKHSEILVLTDIKGTEYAFQKGDVLFIKNIIK